MPKRTVHKPNAFTLNHIPVMMLAVASDGIIREASKPLLQHLGIGHEALVGTPIDAIIPQIGKRDHGTTGSRTVLRSKPYLKLIRSDGTSVDIEITTAKMAKMGGESLRLIAINDITEKKNTAEALVHRRTFEKLITDISTRFITMDLEDIDAGINDALRRIGEFTGVDRSYDVYFSDDYSRASSRHEWCAEGITPAIHLFQDVPTRSEWQWVANAILAGQEVHIPRVKDLYANADISNSTIELMEKDLGIQSALFVPLVYKKKIVGFQGFDSNRKQRTWSQDSIMLLKVVGEIIVSASMRKQVEAKLENRLESEAMLARISTEFINLAPAQIGRAIEKALKTVCRSIGIDCGVIILFTEDKSRFSCIHEWRSDGNRQIMHTLQGVATNRYQSLFSRILKGDTVEAPLVARGSNDSDKTGVMLGADLRSFFAVPLGLASSVIGCMGFGTFKTRRAWSETMIHYLKLVSVIFTNALQRQRQEDIVRYERDKLRRVFNAFGEAIFIINRERDVEYQNAAAEALIDCRQKVRCYEALFNADEACDFCLADQALACEEIVQTEIRVGDKDFEAIFTPFTDMDGENKAIVLLKNITEKKQMMAETIRVGQLASLGELSAGVAHEINNPINGIINYAERLESDCQLPHGSSDIPLKIIAESERIARIVRKLLYFSRAPEERPMPSRVNEILANTLSLVEKQILKSGINLRVEIPKNLPMISARDQEIQQVFLNVISNARYALNQKFVNAHPDKRMTIAAEMIRRRSRTYVRTSFLDQGMGVPAELLNKISLPFVSTKPKGAGTGLGLSISHSIVQGHGGNLHIDSVEGAFTKVVVDLPAHSETQK